jgi:hypothetical protein
MKSPFLLRRDPVPTDPVFFYSLKQDACDFDGISFPATNQTANGDLCAYIPNTNPLLLYACPAPDNVCWSFSKPCTGGNSTTPGDGQISCNNNTPSTWCCNNEYESCTRTTGQINVCWAKTFDNPNKGVDPAAAESIASSAISASQASALNSRLSAISATASTTSFTTSKSSPSGSKSTGTGKGNGGNGGNAGNAGKGSSSSNSLSGGAIAGIVIGVLAAAVLLGLLLLFCLRRRQRNRTTQPPLGFSEAGGRPLEHDYYASGDKKLEPASDPLAELPGDDAASEMPPPTTELPTDHR